MSIFVDTSTLYALLDGDDANHSAAALTLERLRDVQLVTHAYVVLESLALVSRRLGRPAIVDLMDGLLPVIEVEAVGAELHGVALAAYRESASSSVSFVDRTSFAFMRLRGIPTAFAFDADFVRAGFGVLPTQA